MGSKKDSFLLGFAIIFLLFLSYNISSIKPISILPKKTYSQDTLKFLSMGDNSFFYRYLTFKLQTAGVNIANLTNQYDPQSYLELYKSTVHLDYQSTLADYTIYHIFDATTKEDNDMLYNTFLSLYEETRDKKSQNNILINLFNIAAFKLNDKKKIYEISQKIINIEGLPIWLKFIPSTFFKDDPCYSKEVIKNIKTEELEKLAKQDKNPILKHILSQVKNINELQCPH